MKKASVLFLAMVAVGITACSSNEDTEEDTAVEQVTYTLDSEASTLKWHGEENEMHFHDGVISVTKGTVIMEGETFVSGEFTIDPSTITPQTEGLPEEKKGYLAGHLQDTAFLFTAKYPTVIVKANSYKDGMLDVTIDVRGVSLSTKIPVAISTSENETTIKGDFTVDFSSVKMPYLEQTNEETGEPSAKSGIKFSMNLSLKK